PHEWVGLSLVADRGHRPVARVYDGIPGELEQLPADALKQHPPVAAGEIRSSHRAPKQHVSPKQDTRLAAVEIDNVPRRMARQIEHPQPNPCRLDNIALA